VHEWLLYFGLSAITQGPGQKQGRWLAGDAQGSNEGPLPAFGLTTFSIYGIKQVIMIQLSIEGVAGWADQYPSLGP
jgi:hypothetical protein